MEWVPTQRVAHEGPHRRRRAAARRTTSPSTRRARRARRRSRPGSTSVPGRDARPRRIDRAGRCRSASPSPSVGVGGILLLVRRQPPVRPADLDGRRDGRRAGPGRSPTGAPRPGRRRSALSLGLAGIAAAWAQAPGLRPDRRRSTIHYSHYSPGEVTVPAGVPVTFVMHNTDPIDHEWIVGDAARPRAPPDRHGARPRRRARPRSRSRPARRRDDDRDVPDAGDELFICHLPGHEAYGMVGVVRVGGG